MSKIDQKEYLKKYLGIGKKSKKKKHKTTRTSMKIIDDDFDVVLNQEIQEDLDTEDAPQIVAVIDDRPPSLRIDEATNKRKWKPIGELSIEPEIQSSVKLKSGFTLNKDENIKNLKKSIRSEGDPSPPRRHIQDTSLSTLHRNRNTQDNNNLPPRKRQKSPTNDLSPKRGNSSKNSRRSKDRDISPPRIRKHVSPRRDSAKDISPPRNRKHVSPLDNRSNDISPPRKRKDGSKEKSDSYNYRSQIDDISHPRHREDISPPRMQRRRSEDISPPRKRKDSSPSNNSHASRGGDGREHKRHQKDLSPCRKYHRPRSRSRETTRKKSRWTEDNDAPRKIEKTLDGKVAGLQNASLLSAELQKLRDREAEIFKNMPAEFSGVGAKTVARKKRNEDPIDPVEVERKQRQQKELEEKYDKWGKGLKQIGDKQKRFEEEQHEMNKPLARYVDDEDLENYLREQENEEDPMLEYVRRKKKGIVVKSKLETPDQPIIPNRFGIKPGSRWDGKDRSNGYEAKWLEARERKKPVLGVSIYDEDMEDEL